MASNAGTNAAQNDPAPDDDVSRETRDNENAPGQPPTPPGDGPAPAAPRAAGGAA